MDISEHRKKYLKNFGKWLIEREEEYPPSEGYVKGYDQLMHINREMFEKYAKSYVWRKSRSSYNLSGMEDDNKREQTTMSHKFITVARNTGWAENFSYIYEPGYYRLHIKDGEFFEVCAYGFPSHHANSDVKRFEEDQREKEYKGRKRRREKELEELIKKEERQWLAKQKSDAVKKNRCADMFFQAFAISGGVKKMANHS